MNSLYTEKNVSVIRIFLLVVLLFVATIIYGIICGNYTMAESDNMIDIRLRGVTNYEFAKEILAEVNVERKKAGLSQLTMNSELTASANIRARECILRYSHKRTVPDKWTKLITSKYTHAGENLAIGYPNAKAAVAAWMDSPTHRANILGSDYKSIGIGVFEYTNPLTDVKTITSAQHFSNSTLAESDQGGEEDSTYDVTVNTEFYPIKLDINLNDYDETSEIILFLEEEINPMLKISAGEIWGQKYVVAENDMLNWSVANPEIVQVNTDGAIIAREIGSTTIEAITAGNEYSTILNVSVKKPIAPVQIDSIKPQMYTGNNIEPNVVVNEGENELVKGEDYEIVYSDNIYLGTAKIHIVGTGDYVGERILYFSIYDESTIIKESLWNRIIQFFGFE